MFKIYDGREHFYQWDIDRQLIVEDPSITEVHFCNRTDSCSLVCETYVEDGLTLVNVPNILLQTDWRIHVYAYDGKHTKHDICIDVKSRTKPADYIYTETEVLNYNTLLERIEAVDENIATEVAEYLEEHPVEVDTEAFELKENKVSYVNWEYLMPDDETYPTSLATYALSLQMHENIRNTDIYPLYPIIESKASKSDLESFSNDLSQRIIGVEEIVDTKASTSYVDGFAQHLQAEVNQLGSVVNSMNEPIDYLLNKMSDVEGKTTFELIEEGTLTEDVTAIVPDLRGNQYKEIYCYLRVPPMADAADNSTRKGRFYITDSGSKYTTVVWNNENYLVDNWTTEWEAVIHIKTYGKLCSTIVWYDKVYNTPYPKTQNTNKSGGEAPFMKLTKPYLENPGIIFYSKDNVRGLLAGTTYEIWGVKA